MIETILEFTALILGITTTSLITLIVFSKNRNSITNQLFVGFAIGIVGWSLTNYLSLHAATDDQTLFWIRWIMFFVVIQNTCFFLLVKVFPDYQSNFLQKKRYIAAVVYSMVVACVTMSPYLFVDFVDGSPQPGPGMILFIPHAIIFAGGGIVRLILKFRKSRGLKKIQLEYFLAGTLLTFTLVPISNFVVPLIFKNNQLVIFSPLYPIIFSSLIAYAIMTKKLFDVRAAVTRSVAYILLIGTIAGVYSLGLFGIINVLFSLPSQEFLRQILTIMLVVPLALGFQSTKQFFDKVTNRLFYHQAYDVQDVLDKLGYVAASEIELQKLLKRARRILSESFKSSFIEYVLYRDGKPNIETPTHKIVPEHITTLGQSIAMQSKDLVVADELEMQDAARVQFSEAGAALSLRLKTRTQEVGYIIFGDKLSGDVYSAQDKKLLLIVANELAVAIQNALRFEEIQHFNATLQAKIETATAQLRHANDRLKTLDESKDDFISMASHQLRTPLTAVKGYLSMVLEGDAGKLTGAERKMLSLAYGSSQRMVFLISDLLNVSRLKTGKFIIEPSRLNLRRLVEDEVAQLKQTAEGHSLELKFEKPDMDFPEVMLDETKTRQVVMNFIDNALFYTPAGGHVTVKLSETPGAIELRVSDDGIGVPKQERQHLFTKFYRAGNARQARPDGTGLGLFMAKKVIIAQGGSIIFESTEGKGSTFGFVFSKSKILAPPVTASSPHDVLSANPLKP